jgi:hypothetical protein
MSHLDAVAIRAVPGEKTRNFLCGDAYEFLDQSIRMRKEDYLETRIEVHLLGTDTVGILN